MKKPFYSLTLLFIFVATLCAAQEDNDTYKEAVYRENKAELFSTTSKFGTKQELYDFVTKLLTASVEGNHLTRDEADYYKDPDKNWVIVVAHNNLSSTSTTLVTDRKKLNIVLLHRERKAWSSGKEWSEYFLNTKHVLLIMTGRTGITDDEKPIDLGISIENKDSFFKTSFQQLVKVIKDVGLQSSSATDENFSTTDGLPVRLITLKKDKINPPSKINYAGGFMKEVTLTDTLNPISVTIDGVDLTQSDVKDMLQENFKQSATKGNVSFKILNTTTKYKPDTKKLTFDIHERNFFAFSIGITGAQFDYRNFSLDTVKNIAIAELDSAKKKEWLGNLNVNLEFYPFGRDIERLEPFIKKPFYRLHTRFGLYGGVRLNKDPLTAVNAGFIFSYSKTVTLTFGWTWLDNRVADDQKVNVGDNIKTIDKAKEFFRRKYERSKFSIGITFAPFQIAKALGIGDDKESD